MVQQLVTALKATLADKDVALQLGDEGFETVGDTPEAFSHLIESERQQWTKVVNAAHVPTF